MSSVGTDTYAMAQTRSQRVAASAGPHNPPRTLLSARHGCSVRRPPTIGVALLQELVSAHPTTAEGGVHDTAMILHNLLLPPNLPSSESLATRTEEALSR